MTGAIEGETMKTALCVGLSIALLFVFAQPVTSHEREIIDPEPDHPLYWIGGVLYPIGHGMYHLFIGWWYDKKEPQETAKSEPAQFLEGERPQETKYNFSPRQEPSEPEAIESVEPPVESPETPVESPEPQAESPGPEKETAPHKTKYNFSPREKPSQSEEEGAR